MTWIQTVQPEEATGRLKEIYELTKSPHGTYDNVYISKSLRPETIMGHDTLYRSVLHHPDVTLPLWFLERPAPAKPVNESGPVNSFRIRIALCS